jgi:outer membrane protein
MKMNNLNHSFHDGKTDEGIMEDKPVRFRIPGAFRATMLVAVLIFVSMQTGLSQRFAYVDSEYILGNIPSFIAAQDQLEKLSEEWQKEIEARYEEVEVLYRNYQNDRVLMNEEMRRKRENEIVTREAEAAELQRKYFGPEGELFKSQEELIRPIQDQVYNAVVDMATEGNYAVIFDTANSPVMLYTNPRNDLSDEVLKKLGYRN